MGLPLREAVTLDDQDSPTQGNTVNHSRSVLKCADPVKNAGYSVLHKVFSGGIQSKKRES